MAKLKLTPQLQEQIGNNITLGMPLKFAAEAAGITEQTFYNWLKKGETETKGQFYEFAEHVKACKAKAVQLHLKLITKAATEGTWQASAWILERRFPEEFGRREKIDMKAEVTDKSEVPLTPEVVEARHAFLKAVANAKSDN
jgi:transposase